MECILYTKTRKKLIFRLKTDVIDKITENEKAPLNRGFFSVKIILILKLNLNWRSIHQNEKR